MSRLRTGLPWSKKRKGKEDFIQGQRKVREFCIRSGDFWEFYLKVAANYVIRYFCIDKTILFQELSELSLFSLIHGQNNLPARSVKLLYSQ